MDKARRAKTIGIAAVTGVGVLCGLALVLFGMPGHAQSGPPQNDMTVDKAVRNEVIEGVIANLDQSYVYPEKAAAMGKQLRAQMQHGDFDSVTSAERLAETLTDALQRDSHDQHLEVRYFEKEVPKQLPGQDESPDDKAAELIHQQHFNFGFDSIGRLQGDIGYVEMRQFARPEQAAERIAATMTLLDDTKALVIDLRRCGGGDPQTVMLFASYLFDKPAHLNDIYWRDENRVEERWTQDKVSGKKYGETRKVYLLTSGDTFSGCEDLAYALKNIKRATLIGETTGGGAHAGNPHRLSAHFMMFVPSGRPISPVTHTDWETVGVQPDIKASSKNALVVAQIAALRAMIPAETDPDWKRKLQERLDELN
jgi:Peptidase family S41/N-terminal domain of Peptidase_S41 in eukaryotic IRBP